MSTASSSGNIIFWILGFLLFVFVIVVICYGVYQWYTMPTSSSSSAPHGVEIDNQRYLGSWYEQLRLPSWYEPNTFSHAQARYESIPTNSSQIKITNTAIDDQSGTPQSATGVATSTGQPGTYKVSFDEYPQNAAGSYIVLANTCGSPNTDYQCAIVGTNDRNGLWLLTREKDAYNPNLYQYVRQVAAANGYPEQTINRLIRVVQ